MQQSLESFKNALKIMEEHEKEILTMDLSVHGRKYRVDVADMLCLGNDHDNPRAVSEMGDKLPKMLVFFSEGLREVSEYYVRIKEELDMFEAEKTQEALQALTAEIDSMADSTGKKIAATLKKAPTADQIRGWMKINNKEAWNELNEKVLHAIQLKSSLENVVSGLNSRLKFIDAQLRNATALNKNS